jgi:hypothetical protein
LNEDRNVGASEASESPNSGRLSEFIWYNNGNKKKKKKRVE